MVFKYMWERPIALGCHSYIMLVVSQSYCTSYHKKHLLRAYDVRKDWELR